MKTIDLRDFFSGIKLHIEYEIDQNGLIISMKINGVIVERKTELEQNDDVFIYGPIAPNPLEIVHLSKSQLDQMRLL